MDDLQDTFDPSLSLIFHIQSISGAADPRSKQSSKLQISVQFSTLPCIGQVLNLYRGNSLVWVLPLLHLFNTLLP